MTIQINGTSGISGVDGSAGTPALQGSDTNTGISFGADTVNINTGGTTRATVDSSGRVLVGTSSTSSNSTLIVQASSGDSTGPGIIRLAKPSSTPGNGDNLGIVAFTDGSHNPAGWILAQRDGGTWTSGSSQPGRLVFSTTVDGASSPTERMRVSQTGQVRFGRDSNEIMWVYPTGSDRILINANGQNTSGGYFYYNSSNAYGTVSDKRLKNNIKESHKEQDAAFIKAITPHTFSFSNGATQLGFIAQDLLAASKNESQKAAVSNWESYDESDPDCPFLGVSISPVVAALVNTCKLALERIEALEAEVAALKTQ